MLNRMLDRIIYWLAVLVITIPIVVGMQKIVSLKNPNDAPFAVTITFAFCIIGAFFTERGYRNSKVNKNKDGRR